MSTETLRSFVYGEWVAGAGRAAKLVDPSTEETLAETSTEGVDFGRALDHARSKGGPALRAMTFAQRGELLKKLANSLHGQRDALLDMAMANGGNTRSDAKFDVDGAIGTLAYYAELGASLGDARAFVDGDAVNLGRSSRVTGQHLLSPRHGVALHVNAFNFPAWGLAEKAAAALLAGVPVVTKPATATALVAHRVVELFVASGALPDGALSLVCGSAGDLVSRLTGQDVLAFTGGSATAAMLRGDASVVGANVHVNVEADSLNAAVLGPDVERGGDTWQLWLNDVVRDITQKAGQKCTAIRRVFVPEALYEAAVEDLADRLSGVRFGDPRAEGVTMGPVSTAAQLREVRAGLDKLTASGAKVVLGGSGAVDGHGAPAGKGYFVAPTLLRLDDASQGDAVHGHEVFGPSATVIPYRDVSEVAAMVARGGGCLVSSVYTEDRAFASALVACHRAVPRARGGGERQGRGRVARAGRRPPAARSRRPGSRGRRRGARGIAGSERVPPAHGGAGLRALRRRGDAGVGALRVSASAR
ncbi:MAG: 3,4-dehydroadipyl-CoA semialdehyde dehydrogenase [Polyangiales bacterium]